MSEANEGSVMLPRERELARARYELEQARGSRKVRGEAADFDEFHRFRSIFDQNGPKMVDFGSFLAQNGRF